MDEQIAAELARVGIALVRDGELIPAEHLYPQPPSAKHPRGAWLVYKGDCGNAFPPDAPVIDASEITAFCYARP